MNEGTEVLTEQRMHKLAWLILIFLTVRDYKDKIFSADIEVLKQLHDLIINVPVQEFKTHHDTTEFWGMVIQAHMLLKLERKDWDRQINKGYQKVAYYLFISMLKDSNFSINEFQKEVEQQTSSFISENFDTSVESEVLRPEIYALAKKVWADANPF